MATDAERLAQDAANEAGYDNLLKQREAAYQARYQRLFYQADKDRDRWRSIAGELHWIVIHMPQYLHQGCSPRERDTWLPQIAAALARFDAEGGE